VDSVVYGCTFGSEVRWAAGARPDACRPASPGTSRPTVSRLAAAKNITC